MRLLIHAGTHKTATTYVQHVLVLNRKALADRGVYVAADARLIANHGTAWMALRGDLRHLAAHVREAQRNGHATALLSSEDFEGIVFDHRCAQAAETAAREAGATAIEWHFCLRDPGEYFSSMYAQLSRLGAYVGFTDYAALALRDGHVRVPRKPGRLPSAWDLCFDYEKHLRAFAVAIDGTVVVHDFRRQDPFPGHGIIAAAAGEGLEFALPDSSARNERVPANEVPANFRALLEAILAPAGVTEASRNAIAAGLAVAPEIQAEIAAAVSRAFAPGMERLIGERVLRSA